MRESKFAQELQIDLVVKDVKKWEVDPARTASEFNADYFRKLLEKAWEEASFIFTKISTKPVKPTRSLTISRRCIGLMYNQVPHFIHQL